MNLYHISQDVNQTDGAYDAAIVAAVDAEQARTIYPNKFFDDDWEAGSADYWEEAPTRPKWHYFWCQTPDQVKVRFVGVAVFGTPSGVILASFNAG